jgi:asparagine synthase (glutamine-hydrolysing)
MCGLAGELRFDQQPADLAAVERITHNLAPRGPDAWGFHSQGPVALGHRRLKIMDLSDGSAQPMIDSQLGLSLAFNGAIYNFPELRAELEELGYPFYSGGDTEVLLKGYHAWGEAMLPKLNGMFAFAIWERDSRRLFIARDRLGVKPLYLSRTASRLRFASSLPALLKGGDIDPVLDPVALNHYLNFHAVVPAPRTLLANIEKLPPATWLRVDADGRSEQKTWWTLPYGPHADESGLELEDWVDRVLQSTREAVAIRQRAAVDVGVLLSGGVDSSMLVGLLRETGVENLSTFSIGFEDAGGERGDEFQYSDLIAKHYGTRHHQLRIDEREIIEQLPAALARSRQALQSGAERPGRR